MENTINPEIFDNNGNVNISDEVLSVIASKAATSVENVAGMSGSVAGNVAEFLGVKKSFKGVKVTRCEEEVTLDVSIIVNYGAKIPDVAWEVQGKVRDEVEEMTGLNIVTVNVIVDGLNVPQTEEQTDKTEE